MSRPGGSHLRMVVAVGKKLLVMAWKHSAAWTAWCMQADTDPVEGFTFVRVGIWFKCVRLNSKGQSRIKDTGYYW